MDKADRDLLIRLDQKFDSKAEQDEKNFKVLFDLYNDRVGPAVADIGWMKRIGGVLVAAVSGLLGKTIWEIWK